MSHPTPYPGLNSVLAYFVGRAQALLGDNFVGAYLQGSFAVGDFDDESDCDFIVALRRDLVPAEIPALNALHEAIHALPHDPWWQRLEGSYCPVDILRRYSTEPRDPPGEPRGPDWGDPGTSGSPPRAYPFHYLDHGYRHLARSEHDNTQVVRWCLREKGVVLAGPDPKTLVDPVTPEMLREEIRRNLALIVSLNLEPIELVAWQSFWVGLVCRMLHTLATGQVHSKKAGTAWALANLDPRWSGLIARAQAARNARAGTMVPAEPQEIAATHAFARWALAQARS
jgi:hypothetical protein